jgi:hypothetical protein
MVRSINSSKSLVDSSSRALSIPFASFFHAFDLCSGYLTLLTKGYDLVTNDTGRRISRMLSG